MNTLKRYYILAFWLLTSGIGMAQFQINNDAAALGGDIYMLTPDDFNRAGSLWYKIQHDLTQPLNVQGQLFFGGDDAGADGIAFVLQNNCLNAGTAGGGIGYAAMPGQSIAVEFDTYENTAATGSFENNDPTYDHIAVEKMGVVNHGDAANNLFGPVQAHATQTNIEDNTWYDFQISYDPATLELRVYFDNTLRVSYTYDILNNVFGGNPYVYWGFTSSTGGFHNYQAVYINKDQTTYTLKDAIICPGQSVSVELPPLSRFYGQNMALGKTAVSSPSNISAAWEAVDGNTGTRWESIHNVDPQWMYVDLGAVQDLDSVILHWEAAYASQFQLQVSTDAIAWTTVYTETDVNRLNGLPANNLRDTIVASATNIRYVRMYGTARATPYGYSLWEFQVYSTPKYVWSPDDGSVDDIYSATPTFTPAATTTYTVSAPDPCTGAVNYSMTITVDCALPVELLSFQVEKKGSIAEVSWSTSLELNTSHFIVMRSTDGIHFYPIGSVPAGGNTRSVHHYSFNDTDLPASGVVYYQLMTYDRDGSSQHSGIRLLQLSDTGMSILQPVFDQQTALIVPNHTASVTLTVVDVLGRTLLEKTYTNVSEPLYFGESLPPSAGFYVVNVKADQHYQSFKIIKRQ